MILNRSLGLHLLLTLRKCSLNKLEDYDAIYQLLSDLPGQIGMTLIDEPRLLRYTPPDDKPNDNYGLSGFAMLAESHVSLHTWPEYRFASIDLFTCGETIDPWISFDYLKEEFAAEYFSTMELQRGQLHHLKKIDVKMINWLFLHEVELGGITKKYQRKRY